MSDFITSPKENKYKSQIVGELLESTTVPFNLIVKKAVGFTLGAGEEIYAVLEPGTVNEEGVKIDSVSGTTLSVKTRGLPTHDGGPSTVNSHGGGSIIVFTNNWQLFDDISTALNSKYNKTGGILTGPVQFQNINNEIKENAGDIVFKSSVQTPVTLSALAAAAGTDEKAKVSANDTTSGYLNGKLVAGIGVTLTENNDGANETLTISKGTDYTIGTSGSDSYAITFSPPLTSYVDGVEICAGLDFPNTGPATINVDTLGALPIKKGDYFDLETNDLFKNIQTVFRLNVKAVTFTGALIMGDVSATLTGSWGYKTGVYSVSFSNTDRRDVTLTNGATTATWSGGLSAGATANANAQYAQLINYPASLVGHGDASYQHYHDPARNNHYSNRLETRLSDFETVATGGTDSTNNHRFKIITQAANNAVAAAYNTFFTLSPTEVEVSVHNKNPEFWVRGGFGSNAAQDCFIGYSNYLIVGTSLENSVMTLDHFGFIIQDATLFISCGDGAAQTKIDISASVPNVNVPHTYRAYFDGTTATFYVDNVQVGTPINTTVPDGNLQRVSIMAIADATAAAKTLYFYKAGWATVDVI